MDAERVILALEDYPDIVDWFVPRSALWAEFEDARRFVRGVGIKTSVEYAEWCESGEKPEDIPRAPKCVYRRFWVSWADYLGSRRALWNRDRVFREFSEARSFVRSLGLKGCEGWIKYRRSQQRPSDIPSCPDRVYAKEWAGYTDWLGMPVDRRVRSPREFLKARRFARSLGLKNQTEWRKYCKSDRKPDDIPSGPDRTKAYESQWKGYSDWLGSDFVAPNRIVWREFSKARRFARSLGLKTERQWVEYCKSGGKPDDIPSSPKQVKAYRSQWKGFRDWLGNEWREFSKARRFARSLGLKTKRQWIEYCKSGGKPDDIPRCSSAVYKGKWRNWGDWLDNGKTDDGRVMWREFSKARRFARSLGFKVKVEWVEYCKSGEKPDDVPSNPNEAYKGEWVSYYDWLGYEPSCGGSR